MNPEKFSTKAPKPIDLTAALKRKQQNKAERRAKPATAPKQPNQPN